MKLPLGLTVATFSPDGKQMAVMRTTGPEKKAPGTLILWDIETGRPTVTVSLPPLASYPLPIVFIPNDQRMLALVSRLESNSFTTDVTAWDRQTGKPLQTFSVPASTANLVFSPDGNHLAGFVNEKDKDDYV